MILDESEIEAANLKLIEASPPAIENINLCNQAVCLINSLARVPDFSTDDDIAVLRLGIRVLNATGAAGRCVLAGYYQPAIAQIRDIIEVAFLLDLFRRQDHQIARWRTCSEKERKKEFKPFELRTKLDEMDGSTERTRELIYGFYSEHGTHAHPLSVQTISPNMQTMIGPFPNKDIVVNITFDIARAVCAATGYLAKILDSGRIRSSSVRVELATQRLQFAGAWISWQAKVDKPATSDGTRRSH